MTTAVTLKKKRRKMKQMQGLLLLARPHQQQQHLSVGTRVVFAPAKKVLVVLQPQQLQLAYSAQEDQDMARILGRIDLRGAQLEQLPDGFVIYESSANGGKKIKLQDRDRATTDAWFFGVYAAITEFTRLPIPAREYHSPKFAAVLSASLVDEVTDELELELSCQLLLPARPLEKPSIRWKTWKTFTQLQALDDDLRVLYGASMKKLLFPRERKRDAFFGGLRKKHTQELKEQQLALYIDKVFELPGVSTEPAFLARVQDFLGFDSFFDIKPEAVEDDGSDPSELSQMQLEAVVGESEPTSESPEASDYTEPRATHPEPSSMSSVFDFESHCSSFQSSDNLPPLSSSSSSAQLVDVGTEYVEIVPETDPKAAKRLHKSILERVRELVAYDDDRVREFQDQTRYFGRDELSSTEYCAFLLGAFGSKECCQLIPMMARLLPDDTKRNELMDGRSAIWRRTVRRNRRRSKQFSESVVFQQQRNEVLHDATTAAAAATGTPRKMRPKSDSMTVMQWYQDAALTPAVSRHSMIETPSPMPFVPRSNNNSSTAHASLSNQESGIDTAAPAPAYKKSLLDPRRKLQHRASFNHQFSEAVADPIQEEMPTALDSDDDDNQSLGRPHRGGSTRTMATGAGTANRSGWPTLERKSSLAGSGWSRQSQSRLSNISSGSEQLGYGGGAGHFDEYDDDSSTNATANYRLRRSSLKTELESVPPPAEEENPVLARLKKQGAINFMMR